MKKTLFKCEICGKEVLDVYKTVDFEEEQVLKYRFNACLSCCNAVLESIQKARLSWIIKEEN